MPKQLKSDKKSVSKTHKSKKSVSAGKKSPSQRPAKTLKPGPVLKLVTQPEQGGMWKILEQKKIKQRQLEDHNREHGRGTNPLQSKLHGREYRFTKFAGPRRKAG